MAESSTTRQTNQSITCESRTCTEVPTIKVRKCPSLTLIRYKHQQISSIMTEPASTKYLPHVWSKQAVRRMKFFRTKHLLAKSTHKQRLAARLAKLRFKLVHQYQHITLLTARLLAKRLTRQQCRRRKFHQTKNRARLRFVLSKRSVLWRPKLSNYSKSSNSQVNKKSLFRLILLWKLKVRARLTQRYLLPRLIIQPSAKKYRSVHHLKKML